MDVRSPGAESCLLYRETQTIDMTGSSGVFNLALNDGSGQRLDSSGLSFDKVFSNRSSVTLAPGACAVGVTYTPSPDDSRVLAVSFRDETMGSFETVPPTAMGFSPLAIQAKNIAGFGPGNLLRFDDSVLNTNVTPLSGTQFSSLMSLIGGTSPQYVALDPSGNAQINGTFTFTNGQTQLATYPGYPGAVFVEPTVTGVTAALGIVPPAGGIGAQLNLFGLAGLGTVVGMVGMNATTMTVGTYGSYPLQIVTANTTRLTIDTAGLVGIATASPRATLDVNGYARLKVYSGAPPVACSSTVDGALALSSRYTTCVCKGGTSSWVLTSDGSTACTW